MSKGDQERVREKDTLEIPISNEQNVEYRERGRERQTVDIYSPHSVEGTDSV